MGAKLLSRKSGEQMADENNLLRCHLCGEDALEVDPLFAKFKRVTSDCKQWPAGGELGTCRHCGTVQAFVNDEWRKEIAAIYQSYTIYYQGAGAEQNVFELNSGQSSARSDRLLDRVGKLPGFPSTGRLLDIGCGNGGFLRSFSRFFPGWKLAGSEWDDKYRSQVEAIPRVERLYSGPLQDVPGTFDAISLVHVLEHIEAPRQFLDQVKQKLAPDGLLIIQLPYYVENPFELFVADHATHFDRNTIAILLDAAGFRIERVETEWIPKELSVIARNSASAGKSAPVPVTSLSASLQWLDSVVSEAQSIAKDSPRFGIFGTSIAGAWAFGALDKWVSFFVDEDANRVGGSYFDRPIYGPATVPDGSDVYVPLAPKLSRLVCNRLRSSNVRYHEVPEAPQALDSI
jgi:SAM-dependent methyltransferase